MKAALVGLFLLGSSVSAHAAYADCMVTAVLDGALPLAQGSAVSINDQTAIIGPTIYRNATIVEQSNGTLHAVRVIERGTTIEVIENIRTREGALYVTSPSGATTQVAQLICR
jgi:hypothetical protein